MKLYKYVIKNIKNRKTRNILCILGIALSIIIVSVITIVVNQYNNILTNGFKPFKNYTQIIEKGSNYLQFAPITSLYSDISPEIENDYGITGISILFVPNEENELMMSFFMIMGILIENIPSLDVFQNIGLFKGTWPNKADEIVMGLHTNYSVGDTIYIRDEPFTLSGILNNAENFFDRIIIIDLEVLQTLYNRAGKVSTILYANTDIVNITTLENEIELKYDYLDCLTSQELELISQDITGFSSTLAFLFSSLAFIISETFFITIIILNINDRTKEICILRAIGLSNTQVIKLISYESLIFSIIGLMIGIPISYLILSLIIIFVGISSGFTDQSLNEALRVFSVVSTQFTFEFVFFTILLFVALGFLNSLIPIYFILKKDIVENLKIE